MGNNASTLGCPPPPPSTPTGNYSKGCTAWGSMGHLGWAPNRVGVGWCTLPIPLRP